MARHRFGAALVVLAGLAPAGCGGVAPSTSTPSPSALPGSGRPAATLSTPPATSPPATTSPGSSGTAGRPGGSAGTPSAPVHSPATRTAATVYLAAIPQPRGCLVVGPAIVGVKVYLVQKALGLIGHHEIYDAATASAVSRLQSRRGLPATGRVDQATWQLLDTGYPFCVDRFTQQPTVPVSAAASVHAAAAIAFARKAIGLPYIWGGAGPIGYDCSGLALQAMYAGGRQVPGVTTDRHVQASFNTAAAIFASASLQHVPLAQRRPGDLIVWGSDYHHLAIYLGSDRLVEAVRPVVRSASLWAHGTPLPMVLRPFAD